MFTVTPGRRDLIAQKIEPKAFVLTSRSKEDNTSSVIKADRKKNKAEGFPSPQGTWVSNVGT